MARVSAPVTTFTGTVIGVAFSEGVAETDNQNAIAYFIRHGYTVDEDAAALSEETITVASTTPDLATATKAQIVAYAATLADPALSVSGLSKAAVIAKVEAYRAVPTVTEVDPATDVAAGGAEVVITGTNFLEGVADVLFDATSATSFEVDSDTQITAVAPAHAAGATDVTVEKATGTSATGAGSVFTYTE